MFEAQLLLLYPLQNRLVMCDGERDLLRMKVMKCFQEGQVSTLSLMNLEEATLDVIKYLDKAIK